MPNYKYKFRDTLNPGSDETARIDFIGQERDIEHGYFNMGARYYDPELGRFLSIDPLFESFKEQSPYNYCFNNPITMTDGSGMSPKGEKRKEQILATEIDLKDLNDAYASIMQSRYESSRQPPMIDYIVSNRKKYEYYQNVLGGGMCQNMFGDGGGGIGNRKKPGVVGRLGRWIFVNYINDDGEVVTGVFSIDPRFKTMTKEERDAIPDDEYKTDQVEASDTFYSSDFYQKYINKVISNVEDYTITGRPDDENQLDNKLIGTYLFVNDGIHFQGDLDITFNGGQAISLKLTNQNELGVTVRLQNISHRYTEKNFLGIEIEHYLGKQYSFIMLPHSERNFYYYMFGDTPLGWSFRISSMSDAAFISIDIYEIKFK